MICKVCNKELKVHRFADIEMCLKKKDIDPSIYITDVNDTGTHWYDIDCMRERLIA